MKHSKMQTGSAVVFDDKKGWNYHSRGQVNVDPLNAKLFKLIVNVIESTSLTVFARIP